MKFSVVMGIWSAGLHGHSYRPRPEYRDARNGSIITRPSPGRHLFLGLELETEAVNCSCGEIIRAAEDTVLPLYCKEDGSLMDGAEIVSHPATLAAWNVYRDNMNRLLNRLRAMGARSYNTSTCGMHIHASRANFSGTAHIFKVLQFVYSNPRFILKLSRRSSMDRMRQYASVEDGTYALPAKARACGTEDFTRYSAVNVCPPHTIEFRFFRGSLSTEAVYRALQAVVAIIEFTRDAPIATVGSAVPEFIAWVQKSRKQYPDLATFLTSRAATDATDATDS
jgi:hypothetical protein